MHDGQRTRGDPNPVRVEDVLTVDLPDDEFIDREYLGQVFADPHKYLTPRGIRANREIERALDFQPESLLARRCKLVGLITAVAMLISAIITAAVLAETPEQPYAAQGVQQHKITGVEALGAFSTRRDHAPTETHTAASKSGESQRKQTGTTSTEPARETRSTGKQHAVPETRSSTNPSTSTSNTTRAARAGTSTASSSREPTRSTTNTFATVREFYRLVTQAPSRALRMLAPTLLGDGPEQLLDAWNGIEDVRIEDLSRRADGSVLAVLTMLRPDGQPVRVTQVLHFTNENIIDHVQLLSAQHI